MLKGGEKDSLGVQPTHRQPESEPSDGAQARLDPLTRNLTKQADPTESTQIGSDRGSTTDVLRGVGPAARARIFALIRVVIVVVVVVVAAASVAAAAACAAAGGSKRVGEDARHVGRGDAAALIADA